eukprot:701004-Hanusia_phi.AAC.1
MAESRERRARNERRGDAKRRGVQERRGEEGEERRGRHKSRVNRRRDDSEVKADSCAISCVGDLQNSIAFTSHHNRVMVTLIAPEANKLPELQLKGMKVAETCVSCSELLPPLLLLLLPSPFPAHLQPLPPPGTLSVCSEFAPQTSAHSQGATGHGRGYVLVTGTQKLISVSTWQS